MISIVIPAYNSAGTIAATLASVRSQTFHDYEVLITDDGSNDGTLEVCRQYANEHPEMRISVVSIPHSGVAAARNHGLERASGEFVSFLDSDDRWMPEKLEQVAALIARDSQADLIYHDAMMKAHDGRCWRHISGPPPSDPYRHLLLENNFLATTTVTVRRSCLAASGNFDCNPDFEICEDYELWLRLARAGAKFAYIPAILAEIARSRGSLSSNITRHARNHLNVRGHCLAQARDDGILTQKEFKRHINRVAARCQALIAIDQVRKRNMDATARAAAAAGGACFRMMLGGDWQAIGKLAVAARRRIIAKSPE
ncbi:MAG TPA: glycosyltransferase [Candidatus Angelobacter sp.]|jgi:glycosyltransferase involved in cell wall biosynthesis|nr:glycosyltransferase [Candidatus Angelobacter sp.]